eukprot:4283072-Prymnesium_polylepis.1
MSAMLRSIAEKTLCARVASKNPAGTGSDLPPAPAPLAMPSSEATGSAPASDNAQDDALANRLGTCSGSSIDFLRATSRRSDEQARDAALARRLQDEERQPPPPPPQARAPPQPWWRVPSTSAYPGAQYSADAAERLRQPPQGPRLGASFEQHQRGAAAHQFGSTPAGANMLF